MIKQARGLIGLIFSLPDPHLCPRITTVGGEVRSWFSLNCTIALKKKDIGLFDRIILEGSRRWHESMEPAFPKSCFPSSVSLNVPKKTPTNRQQDKSDFPTEILGPSPNVFSPSPSHGTKPTKRLESSPINTSMHWRTLPPRNCTTNNVRTILRTNSRQKLIPTKDQCGTRCDLLERALFCNRCLT